MQTAFLVIFCASLLIGVSGKTKFEFTGTIYCDRPDFRYKIVVYEDDPYKDDVINVPDYKWSNGRTEPYLITAEEDDDGPINLDGTFEIYFSIFHDCTPKRDHYVFRYDIGNFPVDNKLHQKHIPLINVTNLGKKSDTTMGTRRFAGTTDLDE